MTTLDEVVHDQINEILNREWPQSCPSCEPINPRELAARGLGVGSEVECILCRKKGLVARIAHPFGDRWIIQPQ